MPGSQQANALAAKRHFMLPTGEKVDTPLLIPSFSSKGFPLVDKIIQLTSETIEGPILVSAYDIKHKRIKFPLDFSSLVFLDSGGYEAGKDSDLSDLAEWEHTPEQWTRDFHNEVLNDWNPGVPTVVISYDNPSDRRLMAEQIAEARELKTKAPDAVVELLIKPENSNHTRLRLPTIKPHIHALADFPIIGVTEKEIGNSLLDRMENIARLRMMLSGAGLNTPIHVFGSLDTISTILYFISGADIFDGLTWLRFGYRDGITMYKHNFGVLAMGEATNSDVVEAFSWANNYRYLRDMQHEMMRFAHRQDFSCFKYHAELFERALDTVLAKVEV